MSRDGRGNPFFIIQGFRALDSDLNQIRSIFGTEMVLRGYFGGFGELTYSMLPIHLVCVSLGNVPRPLPELLVFPVSLASGDLS